MFHKHLVKLVKQDQIVSGTTLEIFTVKLTWLQVSFKVEIQPSLESSQRFVSLFE